ncbi:MAG: DNA-binding protein WhiA [Erysipelotrichaceae bacterium]|jgi:DNA-binding protein WhiA
MSFASRVKDEITRLQLDEDHKRGLLSGLLQSLASIGISNKGISLTLKTSNSNIAKRAAVDLRDLYDVTSQLSVIKQQKLHKRNIYRITVNEKVKEILYDLDLWTDRGLQDHPRMMFLVTDEMIRAYVAGTFLATGSINRPSSVNYHLEITANSEEHADFLIKLLAKFRIAAKKMERRNKKIVYIKVGQDIADFLKLVGANDAMMEFEDIRINRDMFNSIQRLENVEIANAQRTLAVAKKQIEAIQYLLDKKLEHLLKEEDLEVAMLRMELQDASLNELAQEYKNRTGVSLSKSGIRHRFNKILALKEKYVEREKELEEINE